MSGTIHTTEALVLGHSLEGAMAATLLAARGVSVLWPGRPPAATTKAGDAAVQLSPSLWPALGRTPALGRALSEAGLLEEAGRLLRPVPLQFLDAKTRLTLPADKERVPGAAEALAALARATEPDADAQAPLAPGWFGLRAWLPREQRLSARVPAPHGVVGELQQSLQDLLAPGVSARRAAAALVAEPAVLAGGAPALVDLLHRRYLELGGRTSDRADAVAEFRAGWRGVRCRLASGDEIQASVALVAFDGEELASQLPLPPGRSGTRLAERLRSRPASEQDDLVRLSLVVKSTGLPAPLGPVAVARGEATLLLERRALGPGTEELAVFWRRTGAVPASAGEEAALATLRRVLPFFEKHVVARVPAQAVPFAERPARPVELRPSWRVLAARSGVLGTGGPEGAGLLAGALAARALRLVPGPKKAAPLLPAATR